MKIPKIILICFVAIVIIVCTFKASKSIIERIDLHDVPENPSVTKEINDDEAYPVDIDKAISHSVKGTKETVLPVKYERNYTLYEDMLYVTNNKGKTWVQVPNDESLGYARINEYLDTISPSNLYISRDKISIVYGGRGSENISIITTESQGEYWSVASISKTATHDLQHGYDKLYIDFLNDKATGYLVAVRNEGKGQETVLAFLSVNTGVTWDDVGINDELYSKIMAQFGL